VDDAAGVEGRECVQDLIDETVCQVPWDATRQKTCQGAPFGEGHGQIELAVGELAGVVQRHEVGVLEAGLERHFPDEAGLELRTSRHVRADDLDGDGYVQDRVPRGPHLAHATFAHQGAGGIAVGQAGRLVTHVPNSNPIALGKREPAGLRLPFGHRGCLAYSMALIRHTRRSGRPGSSGQDRRATGSSA